MGTTGSKGGSHSTPHTPTKEGGEEGNPPKAIRSPATPADLHKKGIAALIRPLRPPGLLIRPGQSISEFNVMNLATNLSQRFSVLSGLSFISLVSAPATADTSRRKVTRTRYRGGSISGPGKTAWPVAQTELLFLPEFPVGTDQKMQLIFYGEVSRGAFGQVFHVQCSSTLRHYAMKVLAKSQVCSLDVVKQVKQEVMIQQMCSHHPFITPLTHHWQTRKLLIVMTEYVAYGELHQLWQSLGTLPKNLVALYVAEIAVTIDFLHNAGVIYRDLKMENLLLDEDGHIKLIDFGLSKWLRYGSRTGSICGTLHLMAPEVCTGTFYGHGVDWWSLGVIAYCLVVGRYPVPLQLNHTAMVQAIAKCDYSLPPGTHPSLVSLVQGLLQRDPLQRIHTLLALQQEPLYSDTDLSSIVDKKVAPRKLLEDYIESKTRQNFEDFAGLTSTPKRYQKSSDLYPAMSDELPKLCSSPGIHRAGMSSPSLQQHLHQRPLQGGPGMGVPKTNASLGFHKRSASSPLLHPGRLGHHESILKCVSVGVNNGAAVPILQSPLLRLARQHCINQASARTTRTQRLALRQHAHSFVNITALPSTPSPSLLHSQRVRDRKQRYRGSKKQPSLPTLQQENSTFDSMRISSSINEIPNCLEESSSSTSCEKLFSSHSYHANSTNDTDSSSRKDTLRPLSADFSSSRILPSRNCSIGVQIKSTSPPLSSSPIHARGGGSSPIHVRGGGVPFISTLPPIASSPLPPSTPSGTSPYPPNSPLMGVSREQPFFGNSLFPPTNAVPVSHLPNSTANAPGNTKPNLFDPTTTLVCPAVSISITTSSTALPSAATSFGGGNVVDCSSISGARGSCTTCSMLSLTTTTTTFTSAGRVLTCASACSTSTTLSNKVTAASSSFVPCPPVSLLSTTNVITYSTATTTTAPYQCHVGSSPESVRVSNMSHHTRGQLSSAVHIIPQVYESSSHGHPSRDNSSSTNLTSSANAPPSPLVAASPKLHTATAANISQRRASNPRPLPAVVVHHTPPLDSSSTLKSNCARDSYASVSTPSGARPLVRAKVSSHNYTSDRGTSAASPGIIAASTGTGVTTPGTGAAYPGTGASNSGTGASNPGTGASNPGTGASNPGTGASNPGTGASNPGTGASNPGTGASNPGTGAANPRTGAANPRTGAANPRTGAANPRTGAANPITGAANPRTGATNPRTGAANPLTGAANPGTGAANPGTGAANPGTGAANPGTGAANSRTGAANSGPGAANSGPGAANSGPEAANSGPGAANSGPGAANSGHGAANSGPGAANSGPGAANSGPGAANSGPGAANSGPGAANSGTGAANSGTGAANSGTGAANSGTGAANSGTGAANSGTGAAIRVGVGTIQDAQQGGASSSVTQDKLTASPSVGRWHHQRKHSWSSTAAKGTVPASPKYEGFSYRKSYPCYRSAVGHVSIKSNHDVAILDIDQTRLPLNASSSNDNSHSNSNYKASDTRSAAQTSYLAMVNDNSFKQHVCFNKQVQSADQCLHAKLKEQSGLQDVAADFKTNKECVDRNLGEETSVSSDVKVYSISIPLVVEPQFCSIDSEANNKLPTSCSVDTTNPSRDQKLASFQRSRDRITAFQKDLLKYEIPAAAAADDRSTVHTYESFTRDNTSVVQKYDPHTKDDTPVNSNTFSVPILSTGTNASFTSPDVASTVTKIRTSPLTAYRTKLTTLPSAISISSSGTTAVTSSSDITPFSSSPKLTHCSPSTSRHSPAIRTSPHFRYKHNSSSAPTRGPSQACTATHKPRPSSSEGCYPSPADTGYHYLSARQQGCRTSPGGLHASRSSPATFTSIPASSRSSSPPLSPSPGVEGGSYGAGVCASRLAPAEEDSQLPFSGHSKSASDIGRGVEVDPNSTPTPPISSHLCYSKGTISNSPTTIATTRTRSSTETWSSFQHSTTASMMPRENKSLCSTPAYATIAAEMSINSFRGKGCSSGHSVSVGEKSNRDTVSPAIREYSSPTCVSKNATTSVASVASGYSRNTICGDGGSSVSSSNPSTTDTNNSNVDDSDTATNTNVALLNNNNYSIHQ